MSSTESELTALAELAIELLVFIGIAEAHGMAIDYAVECGTDNKGAYDLCHRFTSAQHSRHIDRKLYKRREMRGAGRVTVKYVPTDDNTADIFTKIFSRQPLKSTAARCSISRPCRRPESDYQLTPRASRRPLYAAVDPLLRAGGAVRHGWFRW